METCLEMKRCVLKKQMCKITGSLKFSGGAMVVVGHLHSHCARWRDLDRVVLHAQSVYVELVR